LNGLREGPGLRDERGRRSEFFDGERIVVMNLAPSRGRDKPKIAPMLPSVNLDLVV
jgi:hypothetical protein